MELTAKMLEAIRAEHQDALKRLGAEMNAHAGAIAQVDELLAVLRAPAAEVNNENKENRP